MICAQRHVALAARALGDVFLTRRAETSLGRFAGRYPDVASGHILECDLRGGAGVADYSLALLSGQPGPAGAAVSGTVAAVLRGFCDGALPASVLWLEHDMSATGDLGEPSVFLAPVSGSEDAEAAEQVALALCRALWPGQPCPRVRYLMGQVPQDGFLKQIGAMAGRDGLMAPSLRLVIDGIAPNAVMSLLEVLGWPGSLGLAADIAGLAARHLTKGRCRVDLDLANDLTPTLGLELPARGIGAIPAFAADLRAGGLCSTSKAKALPALAARHTLADRDPDTPSERLDFGLNHVKLSLTSDDVENSTSAKAYFSLVSTPDFSGMG
ncbi:hypothetical protein [Antarcticimicrobium sediminis]|uniref:Uncharacterized protein n=1 Tax=Antarcticimicrobium sediminis TaxID=2546227 RepID=A0A4R5EYT8_9RHOB|nr:hypothetical protein [Antarcticimicrobium sediminis]TDE40010.1 hypothetical protein E1B25_03355 [Antarcticimicrobium sediminis]